MNKIFAACFATAMVGTLMVGCDLLPTGTTESKAPRITINLPDTLTLDTTAAITGQIRADEEITSVGYRILNSDNAVATGVTLGNKPNIGGIDQYDFEGNSLTVVVGPNASAGFYYLEITVTAGPEGTYKDKFYVKGKTVVVDPDPVGTPVDTATIKAGANKNSSYGSSIDLDAGKAYKMADAENHQSEIDLCYAYSGTSSVEKIGTAVWAQNSGFDFAATWLNPTNVKFYPVTMSASEFAAVKTKEDMPTFDASKAVSSSECKAGDVFIVKTTAGAIALIRINSQTEGSTGYIEIKMSK